MFANTMTSAIGDFFLKEVAGLPVWAFFAIGAAIIIIAIIAVCAAVSSKKKKAAPSTTETDAEVAPAVEQTIEPEVKAVGETVAAPVISKKEKEQKPEPAAEKPKENVVSEKPVEQKVEEAPAEEIKAEVSEKEEAPAEAAKPEKAEDDKKVAADVKKKPATKAPAKKPAAAKPAEKAPAKPAKEAKAEDKPAEKKTETKEAAKEPAKKPSAKGKAPVAIPVEATKKAPKKISLVDDENAKTFGKYQVFIDNPDSERPYKFRLLANNGQMLFESDSFKIKPNARNIKAFQGNVKDGEFMIEDDAKSDTFFVKLYSKNRTLIGIGESYSSKDACENSIDSIKRFAESAIVIEDLSVTE